MIESIKKEKEKTNHDVKSLNVYKDKLKDIHEYNNIREFILYITRY